MSTTTKKDLIDRIADDTDQKRADVKRVVQAFLDNVIIELSHGNRLEFRDFGVFEIRDRKPRIAQNPKTLEQVPVPAKRTVKFKVGRLMKLALEGEVDLSSGEASVGARRRTGEPCDATVAHGTNGQAANGQANGAAPEITTTVRPAAHEPDAAARPSVAEPANV